MQLQPAHKAFVEAVIRKEAEKLIRGKMSSATKKQYNAAAKASAQVTREIDKKQRPTAQTSWLKATAKDANAKMEREARLVTKATYKSMKSQGKISALGAAPFVAAGSVIAYTAAPDAAKQTLLRRDVIGGLAAVVGLGLVVTPTSATAGNNGLIDALAKGAKGHAAAVAFSIISAVAEG